MKGCKVEVQDSNIGTWRGLVVSDADHYQKDIEDSGDYLHFWHVLVLGVDGQVYSVDVDDITVIRTDSGLDPKYL